MNTRARMSPVRVKDLLVSAVPELRERLLEDSIRTNWARIVGPEFSRQSRPGSLKMGTLEVLVDHSPLLHELKLRSSELLAAVQRFRPDVVSALRMSLGSRPAARVSIPPQRSSRAPRLAADEARWVDATLAPVPDPALAASLRRLLTKDLLSHRPRGRSQAPGASPVEKETA